MSAPLHLNALGMVNPLGVGKAEVARHLFDGARHGLAPRCGLLVDRAAMVGAVGRPLPPVPPALADQDSRNNRLLQLALLEIADDVARARRRHGAERIAVVLGTSTSGIAETERHMPARERDGAWPEAYRLAQQEMGSPAEFAARLLALAGPAYVVSTACASSAKVLAAGARLIAAGLCDAAVVGGVDSLCRLTLRGFDALASLDDAACSPLALERRGINIGEGAAVFLLSREPPGPRLLAVGESSDAHHMSAPDPSGEGARAAMLAALDRAGVDAAAVDYVNLHGTATELNDAMESAAVWSLFGDRVPCSSTKGMTGHLLGAAGATEAGFLWLALSPEHSGGRLPPHVFNGAADPALPPLRLAAVGDRFPAKPRLALLSNSFAFGGSNASVLLGTGW